MEPPKSPKRSKSNIEPKQEIILVTYDLSLKQLITNVYRWICKEYASVYIITSLNEKQNYSSKRNSLLTKRAIKYLYLEQFNSSLCKKSTPYYSNFTQCLHYCDNTCDKGQLENDFPTMDIISLGTKQDFNSLYAKATKHLHLDFIWLGVCGRLGYSLREFEMSVKEFQNYNTENIDYIDCFLEVLNSQISPELYSTYDLNPEILPTILKEIFQKCSSQVTQKLADIQQTISQLICQRFSEYILVSSPTYHNYYKLLKTRNYFKSIWIEEPALKRYSNFKKSIEDDSRFTQIFKWVGDKIENFLLLDDYIYETFQQRVAYEADFVINTGIVKQGYRQIIEKNYKQIFRKYRADFDEYFISLCKILKTRSGCIKQAVGSIIVKNKRILSTGYNGTPVGSINCYNGGCRICNDSNKLNTVVLSCNCIHAEYSCIIEAGIESTFGTTLYTTQLPCLWCAKVITQAKISEVVYIQSECNLLQYDTQDRVLELFKQANIRLKEFTGREKRFSKS